MTPHTKNDFIKRKFYFLILYSINEQKYSIKTSRVGLGSLYKSGNTTSARI